jgi:hypothetical protein
MRFKNLLLGTFLANPLCLVVTTVQSCDKDDVKLPEIDLNDYKDQIKDMLVIGAQKSDVVSEITEFFMNKFQGDNLERVTPDVRELSERSAPGYIMPRTYRIYLHISNSSHPNATTNEINVDVDSISLSDLDSVEFAKYVALTDSSYFNDDNENNYGKESILRYFLPDDLNDGGLNLWVRDHFEYEELFQSYHFVNKSATNDNNNYEFIEDGDTINFSANSDNPLFEGNFTFEYKKEYIDIYQELNDNFYSFINKQNNFQDWTTALHKMLPEYIDKRNIMDDWINAKFITICDSDGNDKKLSIKNQVVLEDGDTLTIKIKDQSYMADVDGEWTYHSNN